jgi:hypothetical protein
VIASLACGFTQNIRVMHEQRFTTPNTNLKLISWFITQNTKATLAVATKQVRNS